MLVDGPFLRGRLLYSPPTSRISAISLSASPVNAAMQPQQAPCSSGSTLGARFRYESDLTELFSLATVRLRVASPTAPAATPQPEPKSRNDIFTT